MGEITEKRKTKFAEQIEDTHVLFKQFVEKSVLNWIFQGCDRGILVRGTGT